uniref:Reverse transcriptase zinc-binding domain-containing protein n=1 Tax=Fagus sylvatica TaxID=28930 RepID=A0A2N9HH70_FAGSY
MGRATLIKSVAQASPVYTMSTCKLSKKLCNELDGVGGLGFRSYESFNEAMIAKLARWVLSGRDSFCVKLGVLANWWGLGILFSFGMSLGFLGLPDFKPVPKASLDIIPCLTVAQLMNEAKSQWNQNMLSSLFDQDTILAIQNIPREACQVDQGIEVNAVMKKIWQTQLHQRLKMLLWRIAVGVLPTGDSLIKFLPNLEISCPFCNVCDESVIHLFWECSLARAIWFGLSGICTDHFQLACGVDLVEVIVFPCADLVDALDVNSFILKGVLILDLLWKARNNKVHGEDHGIFKWEHPHDGVFKINCDAAVGHQFSSITAVARDWRGNMVFAFTRKVNTIIPLQVEVEAIIWAGHLAISHGFSTVIIETDCRPCVQAVFKVRSSPWQIQFAVMDFLSVMKGLFWWRLNWVRRSANRAPHVLARWSI